MTCLLEILNWWAVSSTIPFGIHCHMPCHFSTFTPTCSLKYATILLSSLHDMVLNVPGSHHQFSMDIERPYHFRNSVAKWAIFNLMLRHRYSLDWWEKLTMWSKLIHPYVDKKSRCSKKFWWGRWKVKTGSDSCVGTEELYFTFLNCFLAPPLNVASLEILQ